jgi:lipoate-protein ligase A
LNSYNVLIWDDVTPRPGWQQMAIDRALADRAAADGSMVYRLYRWEGSTLSFGANEAASRTWDRERLERLQLPLVRRPTGGRGVWHDAADLTYAVTAPVACFGGLRPAYRLIHEQLAGALAALRPDVTLAALGKRPTLAPGACFELAVGGEVLIGGRKVIGSAQALFGVALLQHGAIALADRAARLARFRLLSPGVPVAQECARLPPASVVATTVLAGWHDAGGAPAPPSLIEAALAASAVYATHFRDADWTWRR